MQNLVNELVYDDGTCDVTDAASIWRYGNPGTLRLEAFSRYGFTPPSTPLRAVVEADVGGDTWQAVADLGELHDTIVEATYEWDCVAPLRVAWTFAPTDTRYWVVVVRAA